MEPSRPVQTESERANIVNGENMALSYSLAAMITSLRVTNYSPYAPTVTDYLMQAVLLAIPLSMGGLLFWSRWKRKQPAPVKAPAPQPTEKQRQETRYFLFAASLHCILMCVMAGLTALDVLFHSSLGWEYKAFLVVAINGIAFVLTRSVPPSLSHLKEYLAANDDYLSTAPVLNAPVPAAAPSPVEAVVTDVTKTETAPLVAGRRP